MRKARTVFAVAGIVSLLILTSSSPAITYTYTKIADTATSTFESLAMPPAINDLGVVAFSGIRAGENQGMFKGGGGAITPILVPPTPGGFSEPSINSSGMVAFLRTGLQAGNGAAAPVTMYDSSGPFSFFEGTVSLNDAGHIAFNAGLDAGGEGVFRGNGGAVTTIVNSSGVFESFDQPRMNAAGAVAFRASYDAGGHGIFRGSGGALTTIADDSGPLSSLFNGGINDNGLVAFHAQIDGTTVERLFIGDGVALTPIADTTGAYDTFYDLDVNNSGAVVFEATLDAGGRGIFTGPNAVTDKVIATGDSLQGSVVTNIVFFQDEGMNNAGQIAFYAELSNGNKGIFRANPVPEPAATGLLTIAISGLIARRKRSSNAPDVTFPSAARTFCPRSAG